MKKILLMILPLFLLYSCVTYEFYLNDKRPDNDELLQIYCLKMSRFNQVEQTGENEIEIYPGGRVAMRAGLVTQLHADFTVNIFEGEGLRFSFRTAKNDFENQPAIVFDFNTNGCIVRENERILATVSTIKAKLNKEYRILLDNTGALFNIVVDCDTVYKGRTSIPASEWVVVETLNSSGARLSGIEFDEYIETNKVMEYLKE